MREYLDDYLESLLWGIVIFATLGMLGVLIAGIIHLLGP